MKLEKYVFLLPEANRLAALRCGLSSPLSPAELFIIYTVNYLPIPPNLPAIIRHASSCYYPLAYNTIAKGLTSLVQSDLLVNDKGRYSLSPLGRTYLSLVRRYLLHKRL